MRHHAMPTHIMVSQKQSIQASVTLQGGVKATIPTLRKSSGHSSVNIIYRPPSSSKPLFFREFGLFLTNLGTDAVDRLLICGDFNLPGTSSDKIDSGLAELLNPPLSPNSVNSPTRHRLAPSHVILAWPHHHTITFKSESQPTSVVSSHEMVRPWA